MKTVGRGKLIGLSDNFSICMQVTEHLGLIMLRLSSILFV
jgi:hypothetical protein